MKPIDVLYFVEHRQRELDAASAIAYLLREHFSRSIHVEPIGFRAYRAAALYSPKVVVSPFCPSAATFPLSVFWPVYGEAAGYVNLGFEQLLTTLFTHSHVPRDHFSRQVAHHFAWNEDYKAWLQAHGVPESKIPVTGSVQHAFYLPEYRPLAASRQTLARGGALDESAPWLLFPLNYGGAFYDEQMIEGMRRKGLPEDRLHAYIRFCDQSLECVLDWILEAARTRPKMLFIIRPRPVETRSDYFDRLRKRGDIPPNLRVIQSGPIRDWIINCDLVFSSFSTTLLDAVLADTPALSLVPLPIPEWVEPDWNDQLPSLTDRDSFLSVVDRGVTAPPDADAARVRNQFGLDLGDPLRRVAEALDSVVASQVDVQVPVDRGVRSRFYLQAAREAFRGVASRKGLPWRSPLPPAHEYFHPGEVEERIRRTALLRPTTSPSASDS